MVNPEATTAIQPHLTSGESIVWADKPNPSIIFHKEDMYLIPFSLLWGGFAIFWELSVLGVWGSRQWSFGVLWGIPFIVIGQYIIWGRFLFARWKKGRTFYAVTNRRVIVVQNSWNRVTASAYLDTLPTLVKEGDSHGAGTLRFSQPELIFSRGRGWEAWDSMSVGSTPAFVDVNNIDYVCRLVDDLRSKARKQPDSW